METTTLKTVFEYSMMPIQRYEFTCAGCFTVKTIADHGVDDYQPLCTECER